MRSPYFTAACRLATAAAPGSWCGQLGGDGCARYVLQVGVRQVLAQPVAALGQGLGLAVDPANHLLFAVGQEVVVNLAAELQHISSVAANA